MGQRNTLQEIQLTFRANSGSFFSSPLWKRTFSSKITPFFTLATCREGMNEWRGERVNGWKNEGMHKLTHPVTQEGSLSNTNNLKPRTHAARSCYAQRRVNCEGVTQLGFTDTMLVKTQDDCPGHSQARITSSPSGIIRP